MPTPSLLTLHLTFSLLPNLPGHGKPTLEIGVRAPARERWSWALYDFANTIFSMNVATLYFSVWLVADLGASNTDIAIGNAVASALVALSLPILGAISDARQRRVPWVIGFTIVCCLATAAIGVVGQRVLPVVGTAVEAPDVVPAGWHLAGQPLMLLLVAFIVANYAYQGALPFYNAMLPELVPMNEHGRLSGIGTALGYVGSIVGVLLITPFFNGTFPIGSLQVPESLLHTLHSFIPFTSRAGRVSTFVPTALLFLAFSLPLFVFNHDHQAVREGRKVEWRAAFNAIRETVRDSRRHPGALRFILVSFLYQDAIGTIITFMALYAVEAVGFAKGAETALFIPLTVPAVLGAYLFGRMVDRVGAKRTLMVVLAGWVVLLVAMMLAPSRSAFWLIGCGIGFIFGGIGTAERPLLLSLVPEADAGRYFSLMVLSARAAAVVGPFIWGLVVDGLSPVFGKNVAYRMAVGTVAVGMSLALVLLIPLPNRRPRGAEVIT
jgi:UMF1 family MFS transporter